MKSHILAGLLVCFTSVCFSQVPYTVQFNGNEREVMICPGDFRPTEGMRVLKAVKTPHPNFAKSSDFDTQLSRLAAKALEQDGNVVVVTDMKQHWGERYQIKADVYRHADYDAFKRDLAATCDTLSGIVFYRPKQSMEISDTYKYNVNIEGVDYLMKPGGRVFVPIRHEGTVKITADRIRDGIEVEFKPGNVYYIRCGIEYKDTFAMPGKIAVQTGGFLPALTLIEATLLGAIESGTCSNRAAQDDVDDK